YEKGFFTAVATTEGTSTDSLLKSGNPPTQLSSATHCLPYTPHPTPHTLFQVRGENDDYTEITFIPLSLLLSISPSSC
ncbi:hypothetical protein, partial [Dendronalium phyllosphericum]|uniref:hypothetical protein n=1 Tax=Dendronalium phyllosphericum TaxID=2840445 RepID=UPI001BDCDF62